MKKIISAFLVIFLYTSLDINPYAVRPSSTAVVPDSATAQQIGQILLLRKFGMRETQYFPLIITESKDKKVWELEGKIPIKKGYGYMGGVPYIHIRKSDCCVLKIMHGK